MLIYSCFFLPISLFFISFFYFWIIYATRSFSAENNTKSKRRKDCTARWEEARDGREIKQKDSAAMGEEGEGQRVIYNYTDQTVILHNSAALSTT